MTRGTIFDIRKYSIHDGPGIRTAVFFKGCPLHCAWCHNPESLSFAPELIFHPNRCILCDDCIAACPNAALSHPGETLLVDRSRCKVSGGCAAVCPADALQVVGREMTVDQVVAEVEKDRAFYEQSGGGVTFSGGEPLAQLDFLRELLVAYHEQGLHTTVDTSLFLPWAELESILPLVDLFLVDLKLMDAARHIQYTGVSNELILENLLKLSRAGIQMRVRIPVIPGINDDEANLQQSAAFLASLPKPPPLDLLPYHAIAAGKYARLGRPFPLEGLLPPTRERMEAIAGLFEAHGLSVEKR